MKKLLLILFLVLALCACGKTEVPPEVLPESESSSSEEEKEEWHPLVYDRVDKHIFEFEFRYNDWAEELLNRGFSVSIQKREFTTREKWTAELLIKNPLVKLSIPFDGIYDFNGNIYYGRVLFPDKETAVFCGNKKAVFFSTETLEVWNFEPEFPDYEKENLWINGAGINEKNGEIILFATPMDSFQTEEAQTEMLVFNKEGKFLRQEMTDLRGTAASGEKKNPFFFRNSSFFEYNGEGFLRLGYENINLENKTVWKESGDLISAENGSYRLEMAYTSPKDDNDIEGGYLALLYKDGKVESSMIFSEPDFCDPNYAATEEKPILIVKGDVATYRFPYFAMELTLDFENQTHKLEHKPTGANTTDGIKPIRSSDGKYVIYHFGGNGAGDIYHYHLSLWNTETKEYSYLGEIGGMYGGYNGIGFLKNSDIYRYDMYNLEIIDPKTLEVKFDINDNFPLWYDEETDSGRRLLIFRRNPEDFSYIVVYFEYENGIGWYDIDGNPTGHDGIANCNYKIGFLDPEGKLVESYDTGYGIRSDPFGINNVEMRYSEDKLTIFAIGGKGGVSFEGTFDMKTKKFTSENIEPEIKVPDIFGFRTMVISEGEEISEEDYVEFSEEEFHEFMALLQIGAWTEVPEDWKGKGSVLEPANILISSEKGKNATMYISPEEGKTLIMIKWGHGQEFKKYYFADKSIAFEAEEFRKELAAKNAG